MAVGEGEEPQHGTGRQGMKTAEGSGGVKENPSEALWTQFSKAEGRESELRDILGN